VVLNPSIKVSIFWFKSALSFVFVIGLALATLVFALEHQLHIALSYLVLSPIAFCGCCYCRGGVVAGVVVSWLCYRSRAAEARWPRKVYGFERGSSDAAGVSIAFKDRAGR
jgi:hypothetical protein